MIHDPALDAAGAAKRHAVKVVAELVDGRRLETYVEQRTGSTERPLSPNAIRTKFRRLINSVGLDSGIADAVIEQVDRIDRARDFSALCALLATTHHSISAAR